MYKIHENCISQIVRKITDFFRNHKGKEAARSQGRGEKLDRGNIAGKKENGKGKEKNIGVKKEEDNEKGKKKNIGGKRIWRRVKKSIEATLAEKNKKYKT